MVAFAVEVGGGVSVEVGTGVGDAGGRLDIKVGALPGLEGAVAVTEVGSRVGVTAELIVAGVIINGPLAPVVSLPQDSLPLESSLSSPRLEQAVTRRTTAISKI
jgi:hypothetical protein